VLKQGNKSQLKFYKANRPLQAYTAAASFVPKLTTKVLQYLDPQPTDTILDIGCGDGLLTADIAARCNSVLGLDSSTSFIKTANEVYTSKHANCKFVEVDCRHLQIERSGRQVGVDFLGLRQRSFDKVFSNAAMHWILRQESTRMSFFSDIFSLLKPGGSFVFEMGGAGNVAEVHAVLVSVLCHHCNIPMEKIKEADPWFFPSDVWMRGTLEKAGFEVKVAELEYRPTKATPSSSDGSGGLEGWVRLMGAQFLDLVEKGEARDDVVKQVCAALEDVITRVEDGSQWLGYVRLRAVGRKPPP